MRVATYAFVALTALTFYAISESNKASYERCEHQFSRATCENILR